ncbi:MULTISPECIES: TonB-dependent receptor plug domain-containing protein [unclassified Pseudoalteromonas]|uniref:TonB-dependent receptor plug domain-containing protein n=1 Tax=unclassified Pseudoalteromonas TaxID=194690 RepID=UPI00110A8268|nr:MULTISPECIES: TonB-dependent receptor plug domain-containing protein [unclassified Pseudoalteromonas]TMP44035.1 porin [Pseudoalteromonas sp. S1650]TMP67432.1 porin [Pseudoalteromonas sp. S1649]
MQMRYLSACLMLLLNAPIHANEVKQQATNPQCNDKNNKQCSDQEVERITIKGQYIGIEVPEVIGRAYLDRNFIEATPKGNGDINELIALLPGVQLSEDYYSIDNLAEISAPEISISGAKPWQTGFMIDGMNYNNRLDPASASRIGASENEVSGGVQSMNINSQIVESITVYDHNIPADFGDFSGGVIDAETISAFSRETRVSLGIRGNRSDWGEYHIIDNDEPDDTAEGKDALEPPTYEKTNIDFSIQKELTDKHALLLSVSYLKSDISDVSLSAQKVESRENINALLKYSYRDGWVDSLDLSVMYAPYTSDSYLKDVLNSDYQVEGGSFGFTANLGEETRFGHFSSKFNMSQSDNNRTGPAHFYTWLQAKGKEWGQLADQSPDSTPVSRYGGYGNLDNTQTSFNWRNSLTLERKSWGNTEHAIRVGAELNHQNYERTRQQNYYKYDSPIQYSSTNAQLNCSGYTLDCIEQNFYVDLDTLAEQLGGSIDFNNPEHLLAYSNNVATTAQYFNSRLVTPSEQIDVSLNKAALYATDVITWKQFDFHLGVRYDYDDFFKNHNIAPRLSMGYDVFNDGNTLLTAGLNRYYDAGLLGYKIKEQQKFAYREYRPIQNGYLQAWLPSSYTGNFRYIYDDVKSPYDDEIALGLRHATEDFGNFALKYVHRNKKEQLARNEETNLKNDGFKYITIYNNGTGESERYSLSWDAKFGDHSIWANASYSQNSESNSDYTATPDNTPVETLVYYEGELMSLSELDTLKANFGRPVTANFGWNANWTDTFSTGLTATYSGSYTTAIKSSNDQRIGIGSECATCGSTDIYISKYEAHTFDARIIFALSSRWEYQVSQSQSLEVRLDISNLFNARSHAITEGNSGIEPGRMFWLGVSYNYE